MRLLLFAVLILHIFQHESFCCQENPFYALQEIKNSKNLTKTERQNLSFFIDHLLHETFFGYVLVGGKALAFDNIPLHKTYITKWWKNYSSLQQFLVHYRHDLGRELFSKINFSWDSNFFFFEEEENGEETVLYLINKEVFKDTVGKNIEAFRAFFFSNLTSSDVLNFYLKDKEFRKKILRDPYFLGILLGYGEGNARLYKSMRAINKTHYLKLNVKRKKIDSLNIRPCVNFDLVLKPIYPPFHFPGFVGNPNDDETKKIVGKFKKSRKEIFSAYSSYELNKQSQ